MKKLNLEIDDKMLDFITSISEQTSENFGSIAMFIALALEQGKTMADIVEFHKSKGIIVEWSDEE